MYTVKDHKTRVLKSWHQETDAGKARAIAEANMRAKATGRQYIVTNNAGWILHLALPDEVVQRDWEIFDWVVSALAFAFIMWMLFLRRH